MIVVLAGLVVSIAGGVVAPAMAVDNGTIGIHPSSESDFFHLNLVPGAAQDSAAVITNRTAAEITVLTYPVDAVSTSKGDFAFAGREEPRAQVASWIALPSATVVVPAHGEARVPFRVTVPLGAEPGDYAGGIIMQSPTEVGKTSSNSTGAVTRIDVVQRQGVRIYLKVAGTASRQLSLGSLSWVKSDNGFDFSLPIRNAGNTILRPRATLSMPSVLGGTRKLVFETPIALLPGASAVLQTKIAAPAPVEFATASAVVESEGPTRAASVEVRFAAWQLVAACVAGLLLVLLLSWRIARFVHRARLALKRVARLEAEARAAANATAALPVEPAAV